MPKKKRMAYKIPAWFTHHEPKPTNGRMIKGPLTHWRCTCHEGEGRRLLREKYGLVGEDGAVSFFDRLLQRTAGLPLAYRSWILDVQRKCETSTSLAHAFDMTRAQVERRLEMLVACKWLRLVDFGSSRVQADIRRISNGRQGIAQTESESETVTVTERETPAGAGGGKKKQQLTSPSVSADKPISLSPAAQQAAQRAARIERKQALTEILGVRGITKAGKGDLTLIGRVVDHNWGNDGPGPGLEHVFRLARDVASSASANNVMAVWQGRLKKEGLHYV